MKPTKTKEKALAMYIANDSIEKIAKALSINHSTVKRWRTQFKWKDAREKAIQKSVESAPGMHQKIIDDQVQLTTLANKQLMILMKKGLLKPMELIVWAKHGLEVIRPKTISQLNFMKNETTNLGLSQKDLDKLLEIL